MSKTSRQQFTEALDLLVAQVREDQSIVAAIPCGSLSYDLVWSKSDRDLVLITIDDRSVESSHVALHANGRTSMPCSWREGSSAQRSKDRCAIPSYTHDETIADLCAGLHGTGERDTQMQLLRAATHSLLSICKAPQMVRYP